MVNRVGCRLTPALIRGILLCCILCFAMVGVTAALDFSRTTTAPQMVRITPYVAPVNTTCPEGYQCMFPSEADAKWPDGGYLKNNNGPCGAVTQSGDTMNYRYCYRARLISSNVPVAAKVQPVVIGAGAVRQVTDTDKDGVPDISDNCLNVYNPDQADADHDGIGNACDNCWYVNNTDQKDVKGWCHHLIFVSEYFDATRNVWIKDPACGDACTKPELNKNNPPLVVARPPGAVQNIAGVPAQTQTPGTGPTLSLGTLAHSPLLRQMSEKQPSSWDWLFGAVLCPGKTHCDSGCSDIKTDLYNCGGCGSACPTNSVCDQGVCYCKEGYTVENNQTCSPVATSGLNQNPDQLGQMDRYAGMKEKALNPQPVPPTLTTTPIPGSLGALAHSPVLSQMTVKQPSPWDIIAGAVFCPGNTICDGKCVDIKTDIYNCGGCGNNPCVVAGYGCCNGNCVDRHSDANNCGSCGTACGAGQTCSQGKCFSSISVPVQSTLLQYDLEGSLGITPGVSLNQNKARVGIFDQVDSDGGLISGMVFRTFIHVDTTSLSNGNPQERLKSATLVLPLVKTTSWDGVETDYNQMTNTVWYITSDEIYNNQHDLQWSYFYMGNPVSDFGSVYLAQIPLVGAGAGDPDHYGMDPASGGLEWGQPPVTSKATWDPQKKTLTIDMTDLANKWISGEIQNRGIILTGPEFISNSEGVHYTQSDYDGISFIIQP